MGLRDRQASRGPGPGVSRPRRAAPLLGRLPRGMGRDGRAGGDRRPRRHRTGPRASSRARRGERCRPGRPNRIRVRVRGGPGAEGARVSRPAASPGCGRALQARSVGSAAVTERIVLLPGDGIGPEIMAAARQVLDAVGEFEFEEQLVGGASIDAHGTALTDAVLDASPLKRERIEGTDLIVVRELTDGIYFGDRGLDGDTAHDTCVYSTAEIERIAMVGFRMARRKVTSVDKANILETSRLWRKTVERFAVEEPLPLDHMLVDNAAMQLVSRPTEFDVILTENMFGDILSDEAAMLTGSLGMLPSASVGDDGPGLYEPVHGSAPDIAGTGAANPLAMFLSVAMMLRDLIDWEDA